MVINGILECPLVDVGSKSEGRRAFLTDESGKRYKLYRKDVWPVSDEFFYQYSEKQVSIEGEEESDTGSFLVQSITLSDATETLPQQ